MPFTQSNGCQLHYHLEGNPDHPLVVLVHSLGSSHRLWDLQMPALLPHFQVLRLDLRGHGNSDSTPGDYTIELLARDVLAVIHTTGRDDFNYCGLSLGGMIGQWLGANAGEKIHRLVLANTSPRMPDPSLFELRRKTVLEHGMAAIADAAVPRSFTARTLVESKNVVEAVRTTLLAQNPVGYAGCCAAVRDMDQRPLLAQIKLPVLVIGGDQDVSTPWVGHGELLTTQIAGARSLVLEAAHLSNLEQPALFNTALLDFLLPAA